MTKRKRATSTPPSEFDRLLDMAEERGNVRLKLSIETEDWVAIEGDEASLAFLGEVLLSLARQGPNSVVLDSPETHVFEKGSLGIYIYRRA
jgi:hypothetical protein